MSTMGRESTPESSGSVGRRFLGAPFRLRTYKLLLYLAVAFPLGIAYFVGLLTGGAVGIGLLVTWFGLPILLATLAGATAVAAFEARLAERLAGVDAAAPAVLREFEVRDGLVLPGGGYLDAVAALVTAPSTWTSVVLLATKFAFGLVSFVALAVGGTLTAVLLSAPFVYDDPTIDVGVASTGAGGAYSVGPWTVTTFPEAVGVAVVGVAFLFVAVNGLNALARFHASATAAILRAGDRR
ncbi:MAG: sensor domain-containing protein [Haloferacaceae archaeon]